MLRACFIQLALIVAAIFCPAVADSHQERLLAVPKKTIYPKDIITEDHLTRRIFYYAPNGKSLYVENPNDAVGMAARATLPKNQPIPFSSLTTPRHVTTGATVRLTYQHGGLMITTPGVMIQNGSIGDVVRVRNLTTGVIVIGTVSGNNDVRVASP